MAGPAGCTLSRSRRRRVLTTRPVLASESWAIAHTCYSILKHPNWLCGPGQRTFAPLWLVSSINEMGVAITPVYRVPVSAEWEGPHACSSWA